MSLVTIVSEGLAMVENIAADGASLPLHLTA